MSKPIAVLISDVHYSLPNLKLADSAMRMAINKANSLNVPLIVAGDLHDTKANLRGECVNAILETWKLCRTRTYVLIGNHDKINEKSEENALGFLEGHTEIVAKPLDRTKWGGFYLIPYHSDPDELRAYLKTIPKGSTLIMHQGLQSSDSGDYIHDKSAINKSDVSGFRVISGHYHTRQSIDLPDNGTWDYIGSPYTQSFGEALDPEKGFQVLMSDGSLEFIPTNLRRHRIIEYNVGDRGASGLERARLDGLVWIKVSGTKEQLQGMTKDKVFDIFGIKDFRLDLIPTDTQTTPPVKSINNADLMDNLIDSLTNTSDNRKIRLKELWRHLGS